MLDSIANRINDIIWSPALVVLLVGAGLYFTIRTRCVQIRRFGLMFRLLFKGDKDDTSHGFNSFQAFSVALSGRVGTGNIVGVATAIALGGPGAVFWMWLLAFLGASTAFMESTLAQKYKFQHGGIWWGGPASYIEQGLGKRWLGIVFAVLTIVGYGMLLPMVQSNSIAAAFESSFSVPAWVSAVAIVAILALIVIGGARRIAKFASVVTPFMAIMYVLMSLVIVGVHWRSVPAAFGLIFSSAFGLNSAFGGIVGSAISFGVKRGLFSNEAGEGGGAIVSAGADVPHPAQQGLVQAFSVYIDTLLVCTSTALMILCTGKYNVFGADGVPIMANAPELGDRYVTFTHAAIDTVFEGFGSQFVTISLAFFAFTTIMAHYYFAQSSIVYICSRDTNPRREKIMIWIYRVLQASCIAYGCCITASAVWTFGDIGLGLTTWINIIVLFFLYPIALEALKDYEKNHLLKRK